MERNAYRDENDTDQPDSYWRRRVIMLVAGLSLLGLFAWIFSGSGGKAASPPAKTSQASGLLPAAAYSGAPTPTVTGSGGSGSASASPSASGSSGSAVGKSPAGKSTTRASASARAHATSAPAVASAREPGGECYPSAVVLSLFSSRSEYYAGQDPVFDLYAVSTGSGTCAFDTGPDKLHVVVMSSGRIIWDSADCDRGNANQVAYLSRGVPEQESITWNRSISLPGCVTLASAARAGTYQVQARSATVDSPVRTFKLAHLALADG
jgi:hypothetical protein